MAIRHSLTAVIRNKRGVVLSRGKNSYEKTHPLMFKYATLNKEPKKIFLHAEVDAIIKCKNKDQAYSIEVTYIATGHKCCRPSKPCDICKLAIKDTPIKKIIYSDANGYVFSIPVSTFN